MKADNKEHDIELGVNKSEEENKESSVLKFNVCESGKSKGCCVITTGCLCIIIAILSIYTSLQYNDPLDNQTFRIEGTPFLVFVFGVAIIMCIICSLSLLACARCIEVCSMLM
jgi:hypothetical protein